MKYTIQYDTKNNISDISIPINNRTISMLGPAGSIREKNIVSLFITQYHQKVQDKKMLPVLIGSGAGYALNELLEKTNSPIAVVDKELLLHETQLRHKYTNERIRWICTSDLSEALSLLTQWQEENGAYPIVPLIHPFYIRLDKQWYKTILHQLKASVRFDFWGKAIRPRFQNKESRVLLITTKYFLLGAIKEACKRLGLLYRVLIIKNEETGCTEFVEELLKIVVTFHPDCILTINHFGVDKEGVLVDLLAKLQLPMASWFVDNPHLIVHEYKDVISPWTTIFTWDEDTCSSLKDLGYPHVFYLPLGTSPYCFRPLQCQDKPVSMVFPTNVSFVGNSMVYKVIDRLEKVPFPFELVQQYKNVATAFSKSKEHSIQTFLKNTFPELYRRYQNLSEIEQRLAYETMLTWEATLQYRITCIEQLCPFHPVIVGDDGWKQLLQQKLHKWYYHPAVNYYTELRYVYIFSEVNFNSTSKQMKGAVNQRIFDVPATGSFIITDFQKQIEGLFELHKEVIVYYEPDEAKELIQYYLDHPNARKKIIHAARNRVLSEHTWEHRVKFILDQMRQIYGKA